MKTSNLVNGYILSNLFYELMFLDENGVQAKDDDWVSPEFMEQLIRDFVVPRYDSLKCETKKVVENTLRYLIASEPEGSEMWDIIWQACSAPIPTPQGVRTFIFQCYCIMFPGSPLPLTDDVQTLVVNHDAQIANRLN
ncbi:hypothetical protein [Paracidovorax cattleyae]|uniref:hypothetical protein n=1 Tax=Paracidovorax cattleyae TaxID=80868 RepID=UPI00115FF565|nr:hypothetical protein [Paracidovorax cattleyae]MBF9264818.1 hypothetical protein [Paracidovorax cattleyae]